MARPEPGNKKPKPKHTSGLEDMIREFRRIQRRSEIRALLATSPEERAKEKQDAREAARIISALLAHDGQNGVAYAVDWRNYDLADFDAELANKTDD